LDSGLFREVKLFSGAEPLDVDEVFGIDPR
jgi:hypothetical protein